MISRRRFLGQAIQLAAGATAATACAPTETTSTPTTSSPTTLAIPLATEPTPPVTEPALDVPALSEASSWAGSDFAELDAMLEATNTEAFTLLERGAVVHEWYRRDDRYARDIASAQKSVLSLLVGRAVSEQLFALQTPIDDLLGRSWTPHGQTTGITVEHLLGMTSGLDNQLGVVAEPGTTWLYNNAFTPLFDVLTVTTGEPLQDLAESWLFGPTGATAAEFRSRRLPGVAPVGLRCTASSLAAIGQGVLENTIPSVNDDWYETSFTSNPLNEAYGALWWLNGRPSHRLPGTEQIVRSGALIPSAPPDLVAALGKDDQKLYVSRDLGVVVARLGARAYPDDQPLVVFDDDLWALLTRLRN